MERAFKGVPLNLPPERFIPMLEHVENGRYLLLDVRAPEEYRRERIEGAVNVPMERVAEKMEPVDRRTPLMVYCKVGKRSARILDQLVSMGFEEIYVLEGGMESWKGFCQVVGDIPGNDNHY